MPLEIVYKDITEIRVDALVNSTNHHMIGFSGLDSIIHELGGPEFEKECQEHVDELRPGEAIYTHAYGKLDCKYVIHTNVKGYYQGYDGEEAILRSCYKQSLKLADSLGCNSVALPLIGAGAMGYPAELSLGIAIGEITDYLNFVNSDLDVTVALYGDTESLIKKCEQPGIDEYIENVVCKHVILESSCSVHFNKEICELDRGIPGLKRVSIEDMSFTPGISMGTLLKSYIDARGIKDPEIYNSLHMPRQTFNNLINDKVKTPKRETIFAIAITIKLSIEETEELLNSVGYTFSDSSISDKIVKYFIESELYDIDDVNLQLVKYNEKPLYCA